MARKKSLTLTDAELKIMDVLWERRAATVGDVVAALNAEQGWAYNTVLTFSASWRTRGMSGTPSRVAHFCTIRRPNGRTRAAAPCDILSAGSSTDRRSN